MERYLFVGVGGFIGSICRYGLSGLIYRLLGDRFSYGTLAVNILGCFTIGLMMALFENRWFAGPNVRLFITIGILGGFTTFSTFSYETIEMLRGGNMLMGSLNVLASLFFCLGATWIGSALGRMV